MTRVRRYGVGAALGLLLLVACSGGAAAATTTGASTSASVAASGDLAVNQTHTFRLAPEEPDTVYVDTTLEISDADAFDEYVIDYDDTDAYYMTDAPDFVRTDGEWVLEDGVTTTAFTAEIHTDNATFSGSTSDSALAIYPLDDWDRYDDSNGFELDVDRSTTFVPAGEGVAREDKVLLGPYETYTETRDGTTIELIVSDDSSLQPEPERVTEGLATASASLEGDSHDVSVFGVRNYVDVAGYAGDTSVVVRSDNDVRDADSTWHHEYVHATESIDKWASFRWFTEGYAEYEAAHLALEQGQTDWSDYESHVSWEGYRTVATLSNASSWGADVDGTDVYAQGAITLAYADLRIRQATDDATLQDVVARLHDEDDYVSSSDFLDHVAAVAGQPVADDVEPYVTSEAVPEMWSAENHEDAFGYDPTATPPEAELTLGTTELDEDVRLDTTAFLSEAGDAEIESYEWDWGDGATETTRGYSNQHYYDAPGTYEVVVEATDADGRTDTDYATVEVTEPTADEDTDSTTDEDTDSTADEGTDTTTDEGLDPIVVDDFDSATQWSGRENDLGYWTGGDFDSLGVADGSLSIDYRDSGWFVTNVRDDVSDYSELAIVLRGADGGEGSETTLGVGNTKGTLGELGGDAVGTDYSTVTVDFADLDFDQSSPGELRIATQHGAGPGAIEIAEIRFQ